jgi:streptomycin 6-kinase
LVPVRDQISEGLAALECEFVLDRATVSGLRTVHAEVLAEIAGAGSEPVVLHGDAHGGNLLATDARGWLWIDMEETSRGPVEWDLATMAHQSADGATALRAYADEAGTEVATAETLAPFRRARLLEGAVWSLCMAHLYPARYAEPARSLLAAVLGG